MRLQPLPELPRPVLNLVLAGSYQQFLYACREQDVRPYRSGAGISLKNRTETLALYVRDIQVLRGLGSPEMGPVAVRTYGTWDDRYDAFELLELAHEVARRSNQT